MIKKVILLFFVSIVGFSQEQSIYEKDFLQYWQIVKDNYAYFDSQNTNWDKVKEIYLPKAKKITNKAYFVRLLENCNDELYNGHISLNTNLSNSFHIMPSGTDIWAKKEEDKYFIESVRENSVAEKVGLKPEMQIVAFNDKNIHTELKKYLPRSFTNYDDKVYNHVLNLYLGGTRNSPRKVTVLVNGKKQDFLIDKSKFQSNYYGKELIDVKVLKGNVGYIKFNNSVGNFNTIKSFDKALDSLFATKAMILDLRETASGGNNTVIKAIMGRFIENELPYQRYQFVSDENSSGVPNQWIELVIPRGKIYTKPLIVWVGRWTGSAGEATAIGLDGMKRATIIGTKMAGLLGAVNNFTLEETDISLQIPVTKLYHVNGTQREDFIPKISVKDNTDYLKKSRKILGF